jgi:hypothetical protein
VPRGESAGPYGEISEFAHHLVAFLQREQTSEFPAVFATVERLHAADEVGVRGLLTVGLLEDLQTIAMITDTALAPRFRAWLGPLTATAWDDVHRFWGTDDAAR